MPSRLVRLAFAVLLLGGCGTLKPNERPLTDAGLADGDPVDASAARTDAGDGGVAESGGADGGGADGGASDSGSADSGAPLDIYVDVNVTLPGTGAAAAPLKTITAALAIAPHGATIHVAGGTYDDAAGEQFPLILRGVSLVGSKTTSTTIRGSAYYPVLGNDKGGVLEDRQHPTLVIGDDQAATLVRSVTLSPGASIPNVWFDGILCDRGPTPRGGASNTRVESVTLALAYDAGIIATSNHDVPSSPTGCSLTVVGSKIHGNIVGGVGEAAPASLFAGGSGIGEGNLIDGQGTGTLSLTAGVFIFNHSAQTVIEGNVFSGSEVGVNMGWDQSNIAIRSNTFRGLTHGGIFAGAATIEELRNNRFVQNVAGAGATEPAYGLGLSGYSQASYSQIVLARGNTFLGNDIGIHFYDEGHGAASRLSNFGDATSYGANVFRCNGTAVRIDGTFGGAIPLVGNGWDRNPPNVVTGGTATAGTDVFLSSAGWPGVSTEQAYQAADPCP